MSSYRTMRHAVDCVVDARDKLGEGAFWSVEEAAVYWVDIAPPSRLHRFRPATGRQESWPMPEMISALARRRDGTLLVASQGGLSTFDPENASPGSETGAPGLHRIATPEADYPQNRSNDGAPDAKGRFWLGTMQNNLGPGGAEIPIVAHSGVLWRIGADLTASAVATGIGIANGIAWSPDSRTIYFADTMIETIFAHDFDLESGTLTNKRVFSDVKDLGFADGACIDAEGCLWSARWEGGCVVRFTPDGRVDCVVPIPATRVTSCAFGGPDLGTLYVTSSRLNVADAVLESHPQQGGLFALRPGAKGLPRPSFGG